MTWTCKKNCSCSSIWRNIKLWQKVSILTGGLAHLWDKIKSYLTTWKTSNFGTGTIKIKTDESKPFSIGYRYLSSTQALQIGTTEAEHGIYMIKREAPGGPVKVVSHLYETIFVYAIWLDTTTYTWKQNATWVQENQTMYVVPEDANCLTALVFW